MSSVFWLHYTPFSLQRLTCSLFTSRSLSWKPTHRLGLYEYSLPATHCILTANENCAVGFPALDTTHCFLDSQWELYVCIGGFRLSLVLRYRDYPNLNFLIVGVVDSILHFNLSYNCCLTSTISKHIVCSITLYSQFLLFLFRVNRKTQTYLTLYNK